MTMAVAFAARCVAVAYALRARDHNPAAWFLY
jgi:hypothetical protein